MLHTLTGRLTLGVALFLVLLALVTASTISVTLANARLSTHLVEDTLLFVHRSDLFNLHTARALAETEAFVRTRARSDADEAREQLAAAHDQLAALQALASRTDRTAAEQAANTALLRRQQMLLNSSELHIVTAFAAIAQNDQKQLTEALEAIDTTEDQFADLEAETTARLDQEAAQAIDSVGAQNRQGLVITPIGFGLLGLAALLTLWLLRRMIVRPIRHLSSAAGAVASGNLTHTVQVTSTDEIGELQASFNQMVSNLTAQRTQVSEQQQALEQRASELEHTLEELQASSQERDQLSQSIRELSTPVLPISKGILVMPLIGVIDTQRANLLVQTILAATERHKAATVILDVTGVPLIDTMVARGLLQAAQAIKLLGAQTILVGLRPELAQTITGLGVNLVGIVAQGDLQSGLAYAMQRHR